MSYPYPQDRHRDRKEKGEQPYKDAREAMRQQEVALQTEAEAFGEEHRQLAEEERVGNMETEAEDRLREVGESIARSRGDDS